MKRKIARLLSLVLLIASILSLSGCEFLTKDDVPPLVPPDPDPMLLCYSVTTEKAEYGYGEEIEITAAIQFNSDWRHGNHVDAPGVLTVNLEKSPKFEILSEEVLVFENVNVKDYYCHEKTEKIIAKFKIKFNEANEESYVHDKLKIYAEYGFSYMSQTDPKYQVEETESIYFHYIFDSQGVIIQQIPCSNNHLENGKHDNNNQSEYVAYDYNRSKLITASYNREYLAGVSVEELLDRYVIEKGNSVKMWKEHDSKNKTFSYSYISAGVRFKIYFPDGHEISNLRVKDNYRESNIEVLETLLLFALENGAITEEEYKGEIERISNEKQSLDVSTTSSISHPITIIPPTLGKFVFTLPLGDECFNKVITVTNG